MLDVDRGSMNGYSVVCVRVLRICVYMFIYVYMCVNVCIRDGSASSIIKVVGCNAGVG